MRMKVRMQFYAYFKFIDLSSFLFRFWRENLGKLGIWGPQWYFMGYEGLESALFIFVQKDNGKDFDIHC